MPAASPLQCLESSQSAEDKDDKNRSQVSDAAGVIYIEVDKISSSLSDSPYKDYAEWYRMDRIKAHGEWLKEHGFRRPIRVQPLHNDRYKLISNDPDYLNLESARQIGIEKVPVIIEDPTDEVNLILNRKTPPLQKAEAVRELVNIFGCLQHVFRETGIPKTTLSQLNRLNDHLDARVQEMASDSGTSLRLPLAVLIELSRLPMEKQYEVAQKIASENPRTEQARMIIRADRGKSVPLSDTLVPLRVHVLPEVFSALESVAKQNETTVESTVQSVLILDLQKYGYLSSEIEVKGSGNKRLSRIGQILGVKGPRTRREGRP
jgi:ParB-like chromosome segregation protein Spo0J